MTEHPHTGSPTQFATVADAGDPLLLWDGGSLAPVQLAYKTYGSLDADRGNAVLVFHALTGSQHLAGHDPSGANNDEAMWAPSCHTGWWDAFVGPGGAIDTDALFVICANYLGGCYGSTGPMSRGPDGERYGRRFPWIHLQDVVDSQVRLLDVLGIDRLQAAVGSSLGGFCAIDLAVRYPHRVARVGPFAAGLTVTPVQRAMNLEQVFAIESDPGFAGGDYYGTPGPTRGMALARMISHKGFVDLPALVDRARGEVRQQPNDFHTWEMEDPIESYLLHQGRVFAERFDAHSYLRILKLWQRADLPCILADGDPVAMLAPCVGQRWLQFTIDTDACFPPAEQARLRQALDDASVDNLHVTVHSEKGHDSFLLEPHMYAPMLHAFLTTPIHEPLAPLHI